MVTVRPFKAIRPAKKYVDKVAAPPYDTMNTQEARQMARDNEFSYLRIDRAEIDLDENTDIHDKRVYEKAAENLNDFLEKGVFQKEEEECLYIYREIMDSRAQVGIVGCVSVDESLTGKIKKHEKTKPDKVEDRTNHIRYCGANTGTILLTYHENEELDLFIDNKMKEEPLYDFISDDDVRHTVWILKGDDRDRVENLFKQVDNLYIADGHHRAAAGERYALDQRELNPDYDKNDEFNYYLAMIAPKNNLYVMDYNRVVEDLNGLEFEEFMKKVEENFFIEELEQEFKPEKKYDYGMYIDKKWYKISYKKADELADDIIEKLDVSVLHDNLIEPILGILVPQRDKRIDFIGGIRGVGEIKKRVDEGMRVGFSLYPTSVEELMKVADEDEIMPAKSTWFEPKVRCGLFLHEL
ncbi:DUF1015 domain-containing protein [Peptostreptococcus faecalis]|uniref:DUF1015 domain-containing protein n=1 Tax=Peptostreptococcus faecalis TaxID=2045015 RepID=UPI000C7E7DA4|nr:DUF1015 family protein [Peptostreptococcus faecalis]